MSLAAKETEKRRGPRPGVPRIRFTAEELAERRAAVARLAADGLNDHQIGRRLGVSKTTVAKDRRVLGIEPQSQGQPPKSPLPDERACDTCGKPFRPRRHNVKQGGGRFCSRDCMAQDEVRRQASRVAVASVNAKREEAVQRAKAEGDSLTRDEVAAALGVQPSAVDHYLRKGYLPAVRIEEIPGQAATLVSRQDLEQFRLGWRDGDANGQRRLWLNPDHNVNMYRARGITERDAIYHRLSVDDMNAVYRDRAERRRKLFAARRGRRKGPGPPDYHLEWANEFEYWSAELSRQHEENQQLGLDDPPPTAQHAYLAVAERDFSNHPERWPGYPHAPGDERSLHRDWAKAAADRVRKAVKPLQIPATEMP